MIDALLSYQFKSIPAVFQSDPELRIWLNFTLTSTGSLLSSCLAQGHSSIGIYNCAVNLQQDYK
jgi:hypothetical protein